MTKDRLRFSSKPLIVQGELFTGGVDSANSIVEWALANGGNVTWVPPRAEVISDGEIIQTEITEHLRIGVPIGTMKAAVGDWVIKFDDIGFSKISQADLEAEFDTVI